MNNDPFVEKAEKPITVSRKSERIVTSLQSIIDKISLANRLGYRVESSPVEPLLNAAIDICLSLKRAFQEERLLHEKSNPSIVFDYLGKADALGNTASFKVFKPLKIARDPDGPAYFEDLAVFFSLIKKEIPVKTSMEVFNKGAPIVKKRKDKKKKRKNINSFFYYQRIKRKQTPK